MHLVASSEAKVETKRQPRKAAPAPGGLAGWVLAAMSSLGVTGPGRPSERRMKVVERLAIGAKKELLLVLCGGEHFLIGTGPDGVQTIAPVARQTARVATPEGLTR